MAHDDLLLADTVRYAACDVCGSERPLVQPECLDGHADCPEWLCVECGTAFVIGLALPQSAAARGAA